MFCSGNVCFNPVISNCCINSGECGDGNICTTDTCSGNVCSNILLGCVNNDGCCPVGCNIGNDNDCTVALQVLNVMMGMHVQIIFVLEEYVLILQ